jgi:hypothetical protein
MIGHSEPIPQELDAVFCPQRLDLSLAAAANSCKNRYRSKPWSGGFVRFVPGVGANDLKLAFVDPVTTGSEQRVKVFAAERKV